MERPTCNTCPYWSKYGEGEGDDDSDDDGECRRFPPDFAGTETQQRESSGIDRGLVFLGWHPETVSNHWCGEHPLMGEYIRSLRAAPPVDDSQDDRIDFSGWPVRERKVLSNVKISKWNQLGEMEVTYLKIETWSQLANLTVDELAVQYGCGPFTRSGIVARLEARGLHLRHDGEPAKHVTARPMPA